MTYHNATCGCADCGNYGQRYNPQAIHNQSCGCAACGNYEQARPVSDKVAPPKPAVDATHADNMTARALPESPGLAERLLAIATAWDGASPPSRRTASPCWTRW